MKMEMCDDPIAAITIKQQAVDLQLENSWFFGNSLLSRKSRIVRCNSDPSPSSSTSKEEEMLVLINSAKGGNNKINAACLHRTPSLPLSFGGEEAEDEEQEPPRMGDLIRQAMPVVCSGRSGRRFARTPSLPPSTLTRRASVDSSIINVLPPRRSSKGLKQSSPALMRTTKPQTKDKMLTRNTQLNNETKPRNLNRSKSMKSASYIERREVQGFKDLGFRFESQDLSQGLVDILPGLQIEEEIEKVRRWRPYLSGAWHTPPIPNWVDKGSSEDMKAQIKFWARAVVSNVRQEC